MKILYRIFFKKRVKILSHYKVYLVKERRAEIYAEMRDDLMEKMIRQLYEIEEKANQIVAKANEHKKKLHEEFEQNIEKMETAIASDSAQKLHSLQERTNNELTKEKAEMIVSFENRIKNLNAINKNEHDALVRQVFENIIHS